MKLDTDFVALALIAVLGAQLALALPQGVKAGEASAPEDSGKWGFPTNLFPTGCFPTTIYIPFPTVSVEPDWWGKRAESEGANSLEN
ncbi:hypothetical protein OE88DRAFT_1739819 [Heliocybe sulcata]|uniref:Uncharacterized protein n=1 Tax=Heliocybe sulcata TaxID=5364 RepID=A0A5C3ML26_9AGAM|nr:hypothetical protein OE88DRAFT_1739819 [Heliocybe sulcata]